MSADKIHGYVQVGAGPLLIICNKYLRMRAERIAKDREEAIAKALNPPEFSWFNRWRKPRTREEAIDWLMSVDYQWQQIEWAGSQWAEVITKLREAAAAASSGHLPVLVSADAIARLRWGVKEGSK